MIKIRGMGIDEFLEEVKKFHGHLAPGMVCGGFMVELAMRNLPEGGFYDTISETKACLPDSVQLLTPCTVGNGWLKIINTGRFALIFYDKYTGKGVRVALDPHRLDSWSETKIWAMKLKPKKLQDKKKLFNEIIEAGFDLYKIEKIIVDLDKFSKKGRIQICTSCGESFRSKQEGKCKACKGDVPFRIENFKKEGISVKSVKDSVGETIIHDMTKIEPGSSKGAAIKKGDELKKEDVSLLKSMGKEKIYIKKLVSDNFIHEDEAAISFAGVISGKNIDYDKTPHEGKIDFKAEHDGILCVDKKGLVDFNRCNNVMFASRKNLTPVKKGMVLGGTRAVPLYISTDDFNNAMNTIGNSPLISVAPYKLKKIGIIVTGTEVYKGRIKDRFAGIIEDAADKYNLEIVDRVVCPDDKELISGSVEKLIEKGSEIIVVTGGLSVDPDDVTRDALIEAGLKDEVYGTPVLPGSMTLVGRIKNTRIIGVPAGALYFDQTAFDLLLPCLIAGIPITRADIAELAEGGFLDAGKREIKKDDKGLVPA